MRRGFSGMLLLFLYLLPCSRISRRDSCGSSRASSSGGRSSFSKGPFGSWAMFGWGGKKFPPHFDH
jgi:hypothetical protein